MAKRNKIKSARPLLKLEALEQRQLLAGGFTAAQGQEFSNIVHANGNVYDQVLLKSSAITVTNDDGQITRVSFLDLQGDIVQAEFSGKGSLSISLDPTSYKGPAEATKYTQPGVQYVSGLASFTIQGSDATTNFSLFSVGTATANGGADNAIFAGGMKGGDNTADAARITIVADPSNPNGSTFGGIRAGNAVFSADAGPVGISAANVQIQNVVTVGNINATGTAIPTLIFGTNSQFGTVTAAGGGFVSANGASINNTGSYKYGITLAAGTKSDGTVDAAETTGSSLNFTGSNPFAAVNNVFTLTKSVDTIPGATGAAGTSTNGDDTINGELNGADSTLTNLDTINGGKGLDTLNIIDIAGGSGQPAGITVSGVETVNIRSSAATTFNTSTWSDVTNLNVTQATDATITASKTTAVGIAGATGAVTENGGLGVTVTTSGTTVAVGGTTAPAGAIAVTHSNQAANNITVNGGTTVNVTASKVAAGSITIGGTTKASEVVTVSSTGPAYANATASNTLGSVTVTGGTSVSVTQMAASATTAAATDTTTVATITQSAVTVNGGDTTATVSVTQDAAVTAVDAVTAVAGTKEVTELTFAAMTVGQTIIIDGLTFTAGKALTAAQAAAAFSNLAASSVHGATAASSGVYSGALSANFSSGAVVTASSVSKVTFTASAVGNVTDIDPTTGTVVPTASTTAGTASTTAVTGKMGVVGGAVVVTDNATGKIATVSLSGFGALSTVTSKGLTALTVANSNEDVTITNTAATTLGLTANAAGISGNTAVVDAGGVYTTVNLTATGTKSWVDLTGGAVATLAVSGDTVANLSGSTLAVLKTVSVSGTAGLTLDGDEADTITSINTSATTGAVTATINPGTATYTGGAGADTVTTVTTTTPTKAVSLGAGDDKLTLAAGTSASTSELGGGDGTDTLSMAAADAQTASATATFATKISGFEKIQLAQVAATTTNTIDLDNLDAINYVISGGLNAADSVLNIDNMANAGTLSINALAGATAGVTDVDLKDATGTADSLNVIITNSAGINAGTVNIAGVESIKLTATDSDTTAIGTHTVKLIADKVTSLEVSGNANLTIDATSTYAALATLDASTATGKLTATGNGTIAETIKGGTAADTLTAGFQGDTLIGNAGNDTLSNAGKSLVTLTGGAGADTFDISTATVNVNSYATITDLAAGDKIKFSDGNTFLAAAISLDPSTAVFQDYANAAINATDTAAVSWFQYNGNTYVVENQSNGASFLNGTDRIVKVSGAVDLSASVLSSSADTLLIV